MIREIESYLKLPLSELTPDVIKKVSDSLTQSRKQNFNHVGDDLDPELVKQIKDLSEGRQIESLSSWEEAQLRELGFWRWVAFSGYNNLDPRCFPLHQRRHMLGAYSRTKWSVDRFANGNIVEIGCGPLGMISHLSTRFAIGFDPLNKYYDILFRKARGDTIEYVSDLAPVLEHKKEFFDFAICYNVLDHTENPREIFDQYFSLIKPGGEFLLQVNIMDQTKPRSELHTRMHPSPMTVDQISNWLNEYSEHYTTHLSDKLSPDNEYYFMAWGSKSES